MAQAEFWYEFASSYSYPAAMRIEALAAERGVALVWRPFLLGPLFAAQGWRNSPFNIYPAKGRYMWRDLERVCGALGLPLARPDPFPQNSLLAARVALALDDALRPAFSRAVYRAEFGQGRPIDAPATLGALLAEIGVAPGPLLAHAVEDANKAALKAQTARADRARPARRAVLDDGGRRGLLGQRPTRTGTRLGARPRFRGGKGSADEGDAEGGGGARLAGGGRLRRERRRALDDLCQRPVRNQPLLPRRRLRHAAAAGKRRRPHARRRRRREDPRLRRLQRRQRDAGFEARLARAAATTRSPPTTRRARTGSSSPAIARSAASIRSSTKNTSSRPRRTRSTA